MNTRKLVLSLGLALLAAAPAAAVENLTGTWYGRWKCTGIPDVRPAKPAVPSGVEMTVIDDGAGVVLNLGFYIYGYVVPHASKPSTGIFTGTSCGNINTDGVGHMAHFEVKTKPGDVKATMRGELLSMHRELGHARRCKFTATRVDLDVIPATIPGPCPVSE